MLRQANPSPPLPREDNHLASNVRHRRHQFGISIIQLRKDAALVVAKGGKALALRLGGQLGELGRLGFDFSPSRVEMGRKEGWVD